MREMMQWQVHFLCLWLCASLPHYLILFCGAQFSIAVRRSFGLSHMLYDSRLRVVRQDANLKFKISRATHAIPQQSAQDGIKESRGLCQVLKTVTEKIGLNSDSMHGGSRFAALNAMAASLRKWHSSELSFSFIQMRSSSVAAFVVSFG